MKRYTTFDIIRIKANNNNSFHIRMFENNNIILVDVTPHNVKGSVDTLSFLFFTF